LTIPPVSRLPGAVGDAVVAAEPLRHGLGNAATGGIWRVRVTAGSAILKVARLPAATDPAMAAAAAAALRMTSLVTLIASWADASDR
jgi:hypothetical protein